MCFCYCVTPCSHFQVQMLSIAFFFNPHFLQALAPANGHSVPCSLSLEACHLNTKKGWQKGMRPFWRVLFFLLFSSSSHFLILWSRSPHFHNQAPTPERQTQFMRNYSERKYMYRSIPASLLILPLSICWLFDIRPLSSEFRKNTIHNHVTSFYQIGSKSAICSSRS